MAVVIELLLFTEISFTDFPVNWCIWPFSIAHMIIATFAVWRHLMEDSKIYGEL